MSLAVCVCVQSYAFAEDVSAVAVYVDVTVTIIFVVVVDVDWQLGFCAGGGLVVGCVSLSYRLINNLVLYSPLNGRALAAAMATCLSHFSAFSIFRLTCPTICAHYVRKYKLAYVCECVCAI